MFNPIHFFTRHEPEAEPPTPPAPDFSEYDPYIGWPVTDGERVAVIEQVDVSPYYVEALRGILRVFVVALDGGWSDWMLPEEVTLLNAQTATEVAA